MNAPGREPNPIPDLDPNPNHGQRANRETVLGIRWDNLLVQEALEAVDSDLARWAETQPAGETRRPAGEMRKPAGGRRKPARHPGQPQLVHFLNLDCLRLSQEDPAYREALARADRVLPDGVGFEWVVRMFGSRMRENCRGTDFAPLVLEKAAGRGVAVFLLGGREGVAREAGERLRRQIPGLRIAGARDGYFARSAEQEVVEQVNASGAGLLLVGMGAPLQETWLHRVQERLEVGVAMGVGGYLDIASGRIARAPGWLIAIRLEWLWRVAMEPGRLSKRYFVDGPAFLARVVRRRFVS